MTLTELADTFQNTGRDGIVITDTQLRKYSSRLEELAEYFLYRKDFTMRHSVLMERESVLRMIEARRN